MDTNGHSGMGQPIARIEILIYAGGEISQRTEGVGTIIQHLGMLETAKELALNAIRKQGETPMVVPVSRVPGLKLT